jgi:hypothetical protein
MNGSDPAPLRHADQAALAAAKPPLDIVLAVPTVGVLALVAWAVVILVGAGVAFLF